MKEICQIEKYTRIYQYLFDSEQFKYSALKKDAWH